MALPETGAKSPRSVTRSTPVTGSARPASWLKSVVTLIIILVIVGGGIYVVGGYGPLERSMGDFSFKNDWQAVFLSNGQVYFGQVNKVTDSVLDLRNIYYLQVVTRQNTLGQPTDVQQQPEQQLTLIKLGSEIHGPQDAMTINRDHIVLVEDLKDDSRVVLAIKEFLANQNNPTAQQPTQPTPVAPQPAPAAPTQPTGTNEQ